MAMLQPSDLALIALVAVCGATDVRTGKIYNAVTYPGILSGLLLAAAGQSCTPGQALAGLLVGGVPLFAFFAAGLMGGGDVKLMAAVGAFTGVPLVLDAMFYSVFLGGLGAAMVLVWRGEARAVGADLRLVLGHGAGGHLRLVPRGGSFPFGVAICAGTLIALTLGRAG
jgi:prepilin peptidase CpaA